MHRHETFEDDDLAIMKQVTEMIIRPPVPEADIDTRSCRLGDG
jgi:hypothetical protein